MKLPMDVLLPLILSAADKLTPSILDSLCTFLNQLAIAADKTDNQIDDLVVEVLQHIFCNK